MKNIEKTVYSNQAGIVFLWGSIEQEVERARPITKLHKCPLSPARARKHGKNLDARQYSTAFALTNRP
jgi:hypothetical protein